MSNIPPEPPEPPISTNPTIKQTISRRGKGRRRGRGLDRMVIHDGQSQHTNVNTTASGDPTPPQEGHRKGRRREREGHAGPSHATGLGQSPSYYSDSAQRTGGSSSTPRNSAGAPSMRRNRKPDEGRAVAAPGDASQASVATRTQGRSLRGQFGSRLTNQHNTVPSSIPRRTRSPPPDSDLTTRLTYALRTPPYPDCPICFNSLHPAQPTWSCSLSDETTSCCWASFHLKCVREWAKKSTKETRDAYAARGEARDGEWRCPGCQTKRAQVPQGYLCFCGATADPKPGVATPHSCGMPCGRRRVLCEHPCPLNCHPGPCPPCVLTVHPYCHCTKTTLSIRCSHLQTQPPPSMTCGQKCLRPLGCRSHACEAKCHPGDCKACERKEVIQCYCGKESKQVDCGEGMAGKRECCFVSPDGGITTWVGRFDCENKCERLFACGIHACSKTCHSPSPTPVPCPFDPLFVTHCPCGKHLLQELSNEHRAECTDPVPTCPSLCGKQLEGCSHRCSAPCHISVCPPCTVAVTIPCRCGSTTRHVPCYERQRDIAQGKEVILCERVCGALRLCGRHQCSRACCPLSAVRGKAGKGKKGKVGLQQALMNVELEDAERIWHECDLVCGKALGCGLHQCTEPDHRGPCPPCLRSSFDELICRCGHTILYPPVPCGTRINCTYPCDRPPPPCGHEKTLHACHEDPAQCPPCPFLTTKPCACGKSNISNVRCSQEKVSCGQQCGRLLNCGFHRCQKPCHSDDCGDCSSVCGKPRKLCLPAHHLCILPCHAPSTCNESEPCTTMITVSCPCGRFQQPAKCGKCTSNSEKAVPQLHCRDECMIAKRNARLAEALGISPESKEKVNVVYSEELVTFGKANAKFVVLVEKALNDFVISDKKMQVLPYMPEARRKFVRELCQLYRVDTQLVDQEPRRSVQLHRRIDTRMPTPLLSVLLSAQSQTPAQNLGRLADLRGSASIPRATTAASRLSTGPSLSNRGWTSVVSSTPQTASTTLPSHTRSSATPRVSAVSSTLQPALSNSLSNVRQDWEED